MKPAPLLLLLLATAPIRAAEVTMTQLLSGDVVPLTVTVQELDASWRRFSLSESALPALPGIYAAMLGGAAAGRYYTTGQTFTVGGDTFLAAYRPVTTPIDFQALARGGMRPDQLPKPEPLTADSELQLCLVNLRGTNLLGEIAPFDLETELTGGDTSPEAIRQAREAAARAAGLENLQKIGVALFAYAADGNKTLPPLDDAAMARKALLPYAGGKDIFTETGASAPYQPNPALAGRKLSAVEKPSETVVFYEARPGQANRAVLFLDGRVARVTAEKWAALKKISRIP